MIDEETLLREMTSAVKTVFDACREEYGVEMLVGYAICMDDSGIMFSPVANSQDHIDAVSSEDKLCFTFNPENWRVQSGLDAINPIFQKIHEMYEWCEDYDNDDNWHEEFRSRVYQLAVRTLECLKRQGYFDSSNKTPFLTAWVVDSEVPFSRATSWVKRLNVEKIQVEFANWLEVRKR